MVLSHTLILTHIVALNIAIDDVTPKVTHWICNRNL